MGKQRLGGFMEQVKFRTLTATKSSVGLATYQKKKIVRAKMSLKAFSFCSTKMQELTKLF